MKVYALSRPPRREDSLLLCDDSWKAARQRVKSYHRNTQTDLLFKAFFEVVYHVHSFVEYGNDDRFGFFRTEVKNVVMFAAGGKEVRELLGKGLTVNFLRANLLKTDVQFIQIHPGLFTTPF